MGNFLEILNDSLSEDREYLLQYVAREAFDGIEYELLFELLDDKEYKQAKIGYDPSTALYAQDLDLGRRAALWENGTLEEQTEYLPYLWRYTLLRCSLTGRADQYPMSAFAFLIYFDRLHEALGLAELVSEPTKQITIFCEIAKRLRKHPIFPEQPITILKRARKIAENAKQTIEISVLRNLVKALTQEGAWAEAERVCMAIQSKEQQTEALCDLARVLAQMEAWTEAKRVCAAVSDMRQRAAALCDLARSLAQAEEQEQARSIWVEAEWVCAAVSDMRQRAAALCDLAKALAQVKEWTEAERVCVTISDGWRRAEALRDLVTALTLAGEQERAAHIWAEAEQMCAAHSDKRSQRGAWAEAGRVWRAFSHNREEQARALRDLAGALVRAGAWTEAEQVRATISDEWLQGEVSCDLARALLQVGEQEQARHIWMEVERMWRTKWQDAEEILVSYVTDAYQRESSDQMLMWAGGLSRIREKAETLRAQLFSVARMGEWAEVERVRVTIPYVQRYAEEWSWPGPTATQKGNLKLLLHPVQEIWCSVKTQDDALRSFTAAASLFVACPALTLACCNAFQLVDRFFEGFSHF